MAIRTITRIALLCFSTVTWIAFPNFDRPCFGEDFEEYVRRSEDFRRVDLTSAIGGLDRWNHWVLMPWRSDWGRPYDLNLALKLKNSGFNGGVCNGYPAQADIHQAAGLLWYLDHAAGKGDLYLQKREATREALRGRIRPVCLADSSVRQRLFETLDRSISAAKDYPTRIAYALDDEVSWSSFTDPCRWDNAAQSLENFHRWLIERYGTREAVMDQWGSGAERFWERMATPDDFQDLYGKLWPQWNLSPWADAISYMDSQLCNLIGELVAHANEIDPQTPVGVVGGQCPAPYGGYDYAKLMRKIQFLEPYDLGAAAEIARSLGPANVIPLVKTGFGDPLDPQNVWLRWHHLAHGDRGQIAWAERWFRDDGLPAARVLLLGEEIQKLFAASKLLDGARWAHDGVALYYSHPSIQISWFMDCQPHGRTWINRLSSMNDRLASTAATCWAWTKLLEDAGLQYDFYSYADLLEKGLDSQEYHLLILPRTLAISDAEARTMVRYVEAGGHIVADHCPGWFDQHLRGRDRPVLDDLFGIEEHSPAGRNGLFGGELLTEIDAERYWNKNFVEAAAMMWPDCLRRRGYVVAERDLPVFSGKQTGQGWAHLLNISVVEYLFLRLFDPPEAQRYREPIVELLARCGIEPPLALQVDGQRPHRTEVTRWESEDRTIVWIIRNPLVLGVPPKIWKESIIPDETVPLEITFDPPVEEAVDERTGQALGDGPRFKVQWTTSEAAVVSFQHSGQTR
jgi:hypothetical protein